MSIFRNRDEILSHGNVEGRRTVLDILETGILAGDPYPNVRKAIRVEGNRLYVGTEDLPPGPLGLVAPSRPRPAPSIPLVFDLDQVGHIYVTGGGKAAQREAQALEDILGDRITGGHVNAKKGDSIVLKRIGVTLAGHPEPDEESVSGAQRIVDLMHTARTGDIIFECESGGGTALITLPAPGLTLADIQELTRVMYLEHGAPIEAANAVRTLLTTLRLKHSRHAGDATLIMISTAERATDSLNMTQRPRHVGDEYDYAIYLLKEVYPCWDDIPEAVRQHLLRKDPAYGHLRQDEWFDKPHYRIRVMGPEYMVNAAEKRAQELGLDAGVLAVSLSNLESAMVGDAMGQIAHEIERRDRPVRAPGVLLMGGENVVATGPNPGLGGRNSEFVASAARRIAGSRRIVIGSADSDGSDGPTPNNGGIADGYTVERARAAGLDLDEDLRTHNSCALLRGLGDAFDTGILNTNIQDLRVVYVSPRD
jgi:glycerate 2-kinase